LISWSKRFRTREYLRGSLWFVPLLGAVTGAVLGSLEILLDKAVHLPEAWTYTTSTASTVLSAIVGATAALTGFVVTVTVLVVQMATGSFSARYMRVWYRDRMLKAVLAFLVGTLAFSFALLRRVTSTFVPSLGTWIAGLLLLVCLLLFLLFLDRFLHRLRPVAVAALCADHARRNFREQEALLAGSPDIFWGVVQESEEAPTLVVRSAAPGAIQAIDVRGLVKWAREQGRLVAFRHTIGDFVPAGARLIEAYGGAVADPQDERRLRGMVALGNERTIEQDSAFAIRIMVDVANKALSAAINDPTSAVQVMDHLGDVLRMIGTIDLSGSRWDGERGGRSGLLIPVRRWEDYLALGTTEIRRYGAQSIQVMRRMRAMLDELLAEVRPENRAAVQAELARLDQTVALTFGESVDLDRASAADPEGIGGAKAPRALST
jgi:uncharacterized membrane protein